MATDILFLSHGGGPLPLLGDSAHAEMVNTLQLIAKSIATPSAIVVISAHWETDIPTITHATNPELIYDYSGFPDESYDIEYPAPGEPALAEQLFDALNKNTINASLNDKRGFDHGLFVPLKIMYPKANIPCVQVSMLGNLDPAQHIALGNALSHVDYENLLIVGSGFSFHNMRAFFTPNTKESRAQNEAFENWLIETCASEEIDESDRTARLVNWASAPHARYCHPREEHLLPLHVCYGIAQRACREFFRMQILGKQASAYLW
jgi:4,5-DOPA dioxygenase extradiol